MREKTIVYFLAEITRGYGNGDCILLENYDSQGNITHALIDTGREVYSGVVVTFLRKHRVKKLEFICITHSHADHNGDTISVLDQFQVGKLIMKEFDAKWCPDGTQENYENILKKAIEKNIKVLGVSFESLGSEKYSPSQSDRFKKYAKDNAKKENFEFITKNNIIFNFGSAKIKIINWKIFDKRGNVYVTGKTSGTRDIYLYENNNSLGLLLVQGDKRAFFAGDINNIKKKVDGDEIGDEDRLKDIIGKIDLLKLGHHGYGSSNTDDYLKKLSPDYAIITNDVGNAGKRITDYFDEKEGHYLYTTQDDYEICANIYPNEISLGFGTEGIKKDKDKIFYIPKDKIFFDYLTNRYKVKYKVTEKYINNWSELKTAIEENLKQRTVNDKEECYYPTALRVFLNKNNGSSTYNADKTIIIKSFQKIRIVTNENKIVIKRDKELSNKPLFKVENSSLFLGNADMNGKIIIDGNKDVVKSTSQLIQLVNSEFSMYANITICNNLFTISNTTYYQNKFGSAINAGNESIINIYGGEISGNINEVTGSVTLPTFMRKSHFFDSRGAGIYMNNSTLNMEGGKISNNKGINNIEITSDKQSSNNANKKVSLYQRCLGAGICAISGSKIFLKKGEISDNQAIYNSKTNLITPTDGDKKTRLNEIKNGIYGSAIYGDNVTFEMDKDFIIKNNISKLDARIKIEKNAIVASNIACSIRGGQISLDTHSIKINGGIIEKSTNTSKVNSSIAPDEKGETKDISTDTIGGAIYCVNCENLDINNLKIKDCTGSDKGGAMYLSNSKGKLSNSELTKNIAQKMGGGIFINNSSTLELYDTKILDNKALDDMGGGIYAFGELTIDGENTLVKGNQAGTFGGGLYIQKSCKLNNGAISENKALNKSGGGIRLDGKLSIKKAKIYSNECKEYGGGIYIESTSPFDYDKFDSLVYDNIASKGGNNIYPEKKKKYLINFIIEFEY